MLPELRSTCINSKYHEHQSLPISVLCSNFLIFIETEIPAEAFLTVIFLSVLSGVLAKDVTLLIGLNGLNRGHPATG